LNVDHLDVRVAYLNGILPENERFYCSPPIGFEEAYLRIAKYLVRGAQKQEEAEEPGEAEDEEPTENRD
jgi:hypothetical protein